MGVAPGAVVMIVRKMLHASAALAALGVVPAIAADLPLKARPAPVVAPIYNWTGFYVGGHGGYAWTGKTWETTSGIGLVSYTAEDWVYGGQAGFNWQTGPWVLGVEAQASFGRVREGASWVDPEPDPWVDPEPDPVRRRVARPRNGTTVEHLGTIAGRFGYAVDRSLFFVKGGAAWAHDVYRAFNAEAPGAPLLASGSDTRWGWMVGLGYEYAFLGNWSVKIEYDYLGFSTERITLTSVPGVTPATRQFDVAQDISLVKAGINFRFGSVRVAAKYRMRAPTARLSERSGVHGSSLPRRVLSTPGAPLSLLRCRIASATVA